MVLPASSSCFICLRLSYIWMQMGVEWQLQIRVTCGSQSTEGNAQAVGWRLENSLQPRRAASLMGFLPYLTAAESDAGDERDKDDCCRVWTVVTRGAQSARSWHHAPLRKLQSGNCQLKVAPCHRCAATGESQLSVSSDWSASFHSNRISCFSRDKVGWGVTAPPVSRAALALPELPLIRWCIMYAWSNAAIYGLNLVVSIKGASCILFSRRRVVLNGVLVSLSQKEYDHNNPWTKN